MGRPAIRERWTVAPETGCWVWDLHLTDRGYAMSWDGERVRRAHIINYERFVGPVPAEMELDHTCGNRACVNPDHLEAVTHTENMRRSGATKLTMAAAREIRAAYAAGEVSQRELARRHGVTQAAVSYVLLNRTWRESAPISTVA